MKTIESNERSTGMGATHYTAVLLDGKWVRISDHPTTRYLGRSAGEERYAIDVADDAITATFYRSNSGRETVNASNGLYWESFDEAQYWASGAAKPVTCPHCGRAL